MEYLLTKKHHLKINEKIKQIECAFEQEPDYFLSPEETKEDYINNLFDSIEEILQKYLIECPEIKTLSWIQNLKKEINQKSKKDTNVV